MPSPHRCSILSGAVVLAADRHGRGGDTSTLQLEQPNTPAPLLDCTNAISRRLGRDVKD